MYTRCQKIRAPIASCTGAASTVLFAKNTGSSRTADLTLPLVKVLSKQNRDCLFFFYVPYLLDQANVGEELVLFIIATRLSMLKNILNMS